MIKNFTVLQDILFFISKYAKIKAEISLKLYHFLNNFTLILMCIHRITRRIINNTYNEGYKSKLELNP